MRIAALGEDQPPTGRQHLLRRRGVVLEQAQRLPRRGDAVAAHVGENLLDRARPGRLGRQRLQRVDEAVGQAVVAALHALAEQHQERPGLQHQHPPRLVVAAGLVAVVQGVDAGDAVDADDSRLAHQQLAADDEREPRARRGHALRVPATPVSRADVAETQFEQQARERTASLERPQRRGRGTRE